MLCHNVIKILIFVSCSRLKKMSFSLKNHPFAVETFFESSLVLTFAVPIQELKNLIPECLELDIFNEQ